MDIRLIKRADIEEARWNGCVHYSPNGRIYGYTWYLDNVAGEWEGLVEGNYESVFPLVWNDNLLGFKQLYQPYLCQQLGIFSVNACSNARIKAFLDAIPEEYRYIDIHMNDTNMAITENEGFKTFKYPNYLLYLNKDYEEIAKGYASNTRRNIKKFSKFEYVLSTNLKPEKFVEAVRQSDKELGRNTPEQIYHTAHRIIYNCFHRGLGSIFSLTDKQGNLYAAIFFMYSGARMINLMNVTTAAGRGKGAMHFLMDVIIRQNAGRNRFIDFEGSKVEGVARFYKSFGSHNVPYLKIRRNKLPFWLKWRKPS